MFLVSLYLEARILLQCWLESSISVFFSVAWYAVPLPLGLTGVKPSVPPFTFAFSPSSNSLFAKMDAFIPLLSCCSQPWCLKGHRQEKSNLLKVYKWSFLHNRSKARSFENCKM